MALRTARKTRADELGQVGGCGPDSLGGAAQCFLVQQLLVEAHMHRASSKTMCAQLCVITTTAAAAVAVAAVVSFTGAGCAGE